MKVMLQGERTHYLEMKKSFNAKEMEIRRLKRENATIKQEIQACSNILLRGDQIALKTQREHAALLMNENGKLREELMMSEKKLIDLANEQNLGWIESLLSTANVETRSLKDKLFANMLEQSSLSDHLKKNMDELGKARLDCVKLKMLLRQLVSSNGIKINDDDFKDIKLDPDILENLKVEEYETLEEYPIDSPIKFDSESLNESTIILLGGRERLGNAIPSLTPEKIRSGDSECKENASITQVSVVSSPASYISNISSEKSLSPLKELAQNPPIIIKEESKIVKFSEIIEAKDIDKTDEGYQQSKLAKMRQGVTVKRIVFAPKGGIKNEKM